MSSRQRTHELSAFIDDMQTMDKATMDTLKERVEAIKTGKLKVVIIGAEKQESVHFKERK